ncbi:MAG: hypothetical protein EOP86_12305 [Verrucomicrobiaceae bacterium]|nr:MAG: hypothetical protein EOP86_12305 [Verrucomicrobiaceae bacterium]
MKHAAASCLTFALLTAICPAQGPTVPGLNNVPSGRPPRVVLGNSSNQQAPDLLQRNYRIAITVKQGENTAECSLLTASPNISLNTSTGQGSRVLVTLSGALSEPEGGGLTLGYSIGARFPLPAEGDGRSAQQQVQYSEETATGAIHVTPGKEQTLLKSGDRTYSVTITAVEEKKEP